MGDLSCWNGAQTARSGKANTEIAAEIGAKEKKSLSTNIKPRWRKETNDFVAVKCDKT